MFTDSLSMFKSRRITQWFGTSIKLCYVCLSQLYLTKVTWSCFFLLLSSVLIWSMMASAQTGPTGLFVTFVDVEGQFCVVWGHTDKNAMSQINQLIQGYAVHFNNGLGAVNNPNQLHKGKKTTYWYIYLGTYFVPHCH